jgi:hypothetical protein
MSFYGFIIGVGNNFDLFRKIVIWQEDLGARKYF